MALRGVVPQGDNVATSPAASCAAISLRNNIYRIIKQLLKPVLVFKVPFTERRSIGDLFEFGYAATCILYSHLGRYRIVQSNLDRTKMNTSSIASRKKTSADKKQPKQSSMLC